MKNKELENNLTYSKDFNSWFELKPALNDKNSVPLIAEREVWWCSFGVNVGFEIDGKNKKDEKKFFTRPVLILKKLGRYTFIGISTTGKYKSGSYFYNIEIQDRPNSLIFSQVRTFDCKRLQRKIKKVFNEFLG
jgi:hypothetical protein